MKKILFALVICIGLGQMAHAQTAKGQWLAGGGLSMSVNRTTIGNSIPSRNFGFSLSPRVGYFAFNRLAVGLSAPVSYSRSQFDASITTFSTLTANAFARYYFQSAKWAPFAQGELGYSRRRINMSGPPFGGALDADSQVNYSLGLGLAYFVAPQVAIEGILNYGSNRNFSGDGNQLDFQVGLMLYLGRGR
ncbi:MAG: porin family protein [Bernardetiaceae bacterium]|jgi:hypothetical protein|nr:porin family protein [Bernardetiaceae bacterium]